MTLRRGLVSSIQRAYDLRRPVTHDDINPQPAREFFTMVATRSRGWEVPARESPTPVVARLDAGRWLADCPSGCNGAEMVTPEDPIFLCLSCGSAGLWWPVQFPEERVDIDDEVKTRRDILGWAWNPGETLADLRAETGRLNR